MSFNEQLHKKMIKATVQYFNEHYYPKHAQAIEKAASMLIESYKNNQQLGVYSKSVHRYLNESLFMLNSDKKVNPSLTQYSSLLSEEYGNYGRGINVNDTVDDFDLGQIEDDLPEYDADEVRKEGAYEDFIKTNTSKGEFYGIDEMTKEVTDSIEEEDEFLESLKFLIKQGYFEVTERDIINGHILEIRRVR